MQEQFSPTSPRVVGILLATSELELVPLGKLPTPRFVLAMAAVTLIAFAIGLVKFHGALSVGIKYERGSNSYDVGRYDAAIENLESVVKAYPDALDAQIDLVGAYEMTDRIEARSA